MAILPKGISLRFYWIIFSCLEDAGFKVGCGDKQLDRDTLLMMLSGGEL
jgi:hypothetical protein